ncbi:hypothetical protein GCM10009564_49880 [Streptomyces thermogriseus]|uniref:Secreted protein n=1 Tax=Streptomyces thermogriseus TaxID=75292 RepID=A0ABN1T678_9ACTN
MSAVVILRFLLPPAVALMPSPKAPGHPVRALQVTRSPSRSAGTPDGSRRTDPAGRADAHTGAPRPVPEMFLGTAGAR